MYYILTLSTSQPFILYQENNNVFLYSAIKGHINSKGLLFNDFKGEMKILNNKFIFYQTINNQCKIYKLVDDHFVNLFTLPITTKILEFNNEIYIFYDSHNSLYCIKCSSINKSSLIIKEVSNYDVVVMDNNLIIYCGDKLFRMDKNMKVSSFEFNSSNIRKLESQLDEFRNEINTLKATQYSMTEQYNELSTYTGKLQDELRKYRYFNN